MSNMVAIYKYKLKALQKNTVVTNEIIILNMCKNSYN